VVAQEARTGEVLMVAHMTREALERTLATGQAWYWSRSRGPLWRKGETSGHTQRVVEVLGDCDGDAIVLKVEQTGAACHTGRRSCFFRTVAPSGSLVETAGAGETPAPERPAGPEILTELAAVLADRRQTPAAGSYTSGLFAQGLARLNEKVVAPMPSNQSSPPLAAFQSESTRVRREVSRSEESLSWGAHSIARIITAGGIEGRPLPSAYR